ncbi:MAG: tRNA threonylcarbamoyladenosine dehydratase [Bacilli bacterium]|nr:tRNA threonylcarbamoyladenosine dehydratase [Bacilli bacterium]
MFTREEWVIGDKINLIKEKSVLIIGLGGVGGYALETLVRAGIGKVIIVDNDTIDITNLNRQIISTKSNIGLKKVDEWEKRIKDINPNVEVVKYDLFITEDNIDMLFKDKIDYVVDACDTINTKKAIIRICLKNKIKFITSMGTGNKLDPSKITIEDIRKTSYDPIAKILRKMVKDEKIKEKIMVVSSKEEPKIKGKVGSISYVPATAGLYITSYIINDILK